MLKHTTTAVFCALLLTTFAHDLKDRHGQHLLKNKQYSHHGKNLLHRGRDNTNNNSDKVEALYCQIQGGKDTLEKNNITLNDSSILDQPTGIQVFVKFLELIAPHLDVGKVLNNSVDSSDSFFSLVEKLDNPGDFDRFIKVIVKILGVINGHSPPTDLITTLIEYYTNQQSNSSQQSNNTSVDKLWSSAVTDFANAVESLHLEASHAGLAKLAQDLRNNSWTEKNVNISLIITILLHTDPNGPVYSIIAILVQLGPVAQPQVLIPQLFSQFIKLLNVPNGFQSLLTLTHLNFGDIQKFISNGVLNFLAGGFSFVNFYLEIGEAAFRGGGDFWSHVPVIGPIYESFARALQAASHNALDFSHLLESDLAKQFVEEIFAALRGADGGNGTGGGNIGNFGGIANNISANIGHLGQTIGAGFTGLLPPLPHSDKHARRHKERHSAKGKHNHEH